jgi:drug/metabolite transporter (DMT)-like permease
MSRVLLANLAALGASLSAGVSVVATRFVVGETVPVTLAFYRYVIAALCLAPLLPFVWPRHRLALAEIVKIAMLGTLFFGFFTWAFSAALQYTTAARGAIGLATIPIQTLIVAAIFGREQLTAFKVLSVGLAFAGIAAVFGPEAYNAEMSNYAIGDSLMLLGALSAAIYSAFGRPVLGRHGPLFVMTLAMVFGVLALAPLAAANGALAGMPQPERLACAALSRHDRRRAAIHVVHVGAALVVAEPRCHLSDAQPDHRNGARQSDAR